MSKKKLTPKQAAFVQEYLLDLNATQAAIRAGYSPRTAVKQGHQVLNYPHVAQAIQAAQAERAERTRVTQDDVLERLRTEAAGEGPDTSSTARIRAAELLGKHLGMFIDRVDHTSKGESLTQPVQVYLPDNGRNDRE